MCLYRDQYALLGSWDTCKLKWDLDVGCYYNLWLASYMCDRHLDTAWLETQLAQQPYILRALANFSDLYRKVASTLSERGQYFRNNRGLYDSGRECLHFMTEIGVARSDALELQRTGEIFNAVRDRALDLLDDVAAPAAREPMPLPRFMGRRPL